MAEIKKSHFCLGNRRTFTSSTRAATLAAIAFAAFVSNSACAQNLADTHRAPCGAGPELSFSLGSDWEEVDSKRLGVLCAFRTKNKGFPTLTVVRTPPTPSYERRSPESIRAFLERSYRSVGIPDANVLELDTAVIAGAESSEAVLSFTAAGRQMKALVVSIELPDRAYILTTQNSQEAFDSEKNTLQAIARSAQIDAAPRAEHSSGANHGTQSTEWLPLLIPLLIAMAGASTVVYVRWKRAKRRS